MLKKQILWMLTGFFLLSCHVHFAEAKELISSNKNINLFLSKQLKMQQKKINESLKQYRNKNQKQSSSQEKRIGELYQKRDKDGLEPYEIGELISLIVSLKCELSPTGKTEDSKLFKIVMTGFLKGDQYLARYSLNCIPAFINPLIEKHIDEIMNSFISRQNVYGEYALIKVPLSVKTKEKYKSFLENQIKNAQASFLEKSESNKSNLLFFKLNMLHYCGKLGDESATQELIKIYKNMKWTNPWDKDSRRALKYLLSIGSRDCIITALETFKQNIGTPQFTVGASPRYMILQALWRKHSKDPFFAKYTNYLRPPKANWVLDSEIGGEAGVKKLFSEFSVWAKENLEYDLNLDKVTPKIKAHIVRKYKTK